MLTATARGPEGLAFAVRRMDRIRAGGFTASALSPAFPVHARNCASSSEARRCYRYPREVHRAVLRDRTQTQLLVYPWPGTVPTDARSAIMVRASRRT